MTCPICDAPLDRTALLSGEGNVPSLYGFHCPLEHGVFLPADLYQEWRRAEPADGSNATPASTEIDAGDFGDIKKAKLCPQDGRIMRRYRVTAAGAFWLDRCAGCGGVWFDGAEWDATVSLGLHDQLPALFSDAWERDIEAKAREQYHVDTLRERIGAEDLERVEAFRAWAWAHPLRHFILARLNEREA